MGLRFSVFGHMFEYMHTHKQHTHTHNFLHRQRLNKNNKTICWSCGCKGFENLNGFISLLRYN